MLISSLKLFQCFSGNPLESAVRLLTVPNVSHCVEIIITKLVWSLNGDPHQVVERFWEKPTPQSGLYLFHIWKASLRSCCGDWECGVAYIRNSMFGYIALAAGFFIRLPSIAWASWFWYSDDMTSLKACHSTLALALSISGGAVAMISPRVTAKPRATSRVPCSVLYLVYRRPICVCGQYAFAADTCVDPGQGKKENRLLNSGL